jgi:hypothetical protein
MLRMLTHVTNSDGGTGTKEGGPSGGPAAAAAAAAAAGHGASP